MINYKPLSNAVRRRDMEAAKKAAREFPEAVHHWKPLMDAAYTAQPDMVRFLLDQGSDINAVSGDAYRHTPLIRVIEPRATVPRTPAHLETIRLLVERGADLDIKGGQLRLTALGNAAVGGFVTYVDLLLENGAQTDIHIDAMLYNKPKLVKWVRDNSPDILDAEGRTLLHHLALSGMWHSKGSALALECAGILLDADAVIDYAEPMRDNGEGFQATALWRAVGWQQHHQLVGFLLSRGANPDYVIFAATFDGDEEMLDLLYAAGVNVNNKVEGRAPLADLMYYKRPANVHWLLEHGAMVNDRDKNGMTALHYAALQGIRENVIKDLLDHGARKHLKDKMGNTPLDLARQKNRKKAIILLS